MGGKGKSTLTMATTVNETPFNRIRPMLSLPSLLPSVGAVLALALVPLLLVYLIRRYSRLSNIPGPLLCKVTNLQRLLWVRSDRAHEHHINLHRKYGPIVRFGPNMVSVADPKEIQNIYSFKQPWKKSDFYRALLLRTKGKPVEGIFATQNEEMHRILKRPIANIYSMSHLVTFEPYVDTAMQVFCDQLEKRFVGTDDGSGKPVAFDFSKWIQMLAFDVIGELTFSKRFGFMEKGDDIDRVMADLWSTMEKVSLATQMPLLDKYWTNNFVNRWLRGSYRSPGVVFAASRVAERKAVQRGEIEKEWKRKNRDMLSRFMEAEAANTTVPPYALTVWTGSNITAGSDTTAIFLRTLFYNLLHQPATLAKLRAELDQAASVGKLSALAGFREVADLPYLSACVNEASRMHPPFGLPYERVVPPGGAVVCGKVLEEGTVVGMSAWATQRDADTFGADCDIWNPERWLCEPERAKRMQNALLTFGAGHRSCIGKNIALLEIYKIVPTLLRRFDLELLAPEEGGDWVVRNRWFVSQHNWMLRVRRRQGG